jgi:hypothetical protein
MRHVCSGWPCAVGEVARIDHEASVAGLHEVGGADVHSPHQLGANSMGPRIMSSLRSFIDTRSRSLEGPPSGACGDIASIPACVNRCQEAAEKGRLSRRFGSREEEGSGVVACQPPL